MCRLHQCPISYWVHCPVIWYLLIQPVKKYNYVQITSMSHFILSTLSCNLVPLNTACKKIQLCADYINVPFHTEYTVQSGTCKLSKKYNYVQITSMSISYWVHCPVIWYLLISLSKNTIMCRLHQCPISYWVHCPVIWYLLIQPVNKIQLCADYINVPFHTEYTVL